MSSFLKTKNVEVDGEQVTITQLSGLERFDFIDYCSGLPQPEKQEPLSNDATSDQKDAYSRAVEKAFKQWQRTNFIAQSRLVAHGYKDAGDGLETRHKTVMSTMTIEQVQFLHDEIAQFSGISLPKSSEKQEDPNDESEEEQALSDPKS